MSYDVLTKMIAEETKDQEPLNGSLPLNGNDFLVDDED